VSAKPPEFNTQAAEKVCTAALAERGGNVRSFHGENVNREKVATIPFENVHREDALIRTAEGKRLIYQRTAQLHDTTVCWHAQATLA
jgi:hypothetical protein